jgi:hypothetical protein
MLALLPPAAKAGARLPHSTPELLYTQVQTLLAAICRPREVMGIVQTHEDGTLGLQVEF